MAPGFEVWQFPGGMVWSGRDQEEALLIRLRHRRPGGIVEVFEIFSSRGMKRPRRIARHDDRQSAGAAERGVALLVVLLMLVVVAGSSVSFLWFMNQQQMRAGLRFRSAAAMAMAEAGVHHALATLESVSAGGSRGRSWRPAAYSETLPVGPLQGRFTLSLADEADGGVVVASVGEVAGVARRLQARVYLASPAQLAAVYAAGIVRLASPRAATFIVPYGAGVGDRPWMHVAAGKGIWFATPGVSINDPSVHFEPGPGPIDSPQLASLDGIPSGLEAIRLLLPREAALMLGPHQQRIDVHQLRAAGVFVEGTVMRADALAVPPEVDRAFFRTQASANTRNADLNEAAGRYLGDAELARKRDSLYTASEFERLQEYLWMRLRPPRFYGVVYIRGGALLFEGQPVQIVDGALVSEGTIHLTQSARLEVTHSPATRSLPGLIVLDEGDLIVAQAAQLRVHGLVYVTRTFDVGNGARADIVGSVLARGPELSVRNFSASIVIRYDAAVLGTPGLRVPGDLPVVAWVAAWEEVP